MPNSSVITRHGCLPYSSSNSGARSLKKKKLKNSTFGCESVSVSNFSCSTFIKTCAATGQGSVRDPSLCPSLRLHDGVCVK